MTLLEALIKIRDEGPTNKSEGICGNVLYYGIEYVRFVTFMDSAEKWPKHSGRRAYPVPCLHGGCPQVAFDHARNVENMWNPDHPYGALRLELLNWCIEKLSTSE